MANIMGHPRYPFVELRVVLGIEPKLRYLFNSELATIGISQFLFSWISETFLLTNVFYETWNDYKIEWDI